MSLDSHVVAAILAMALVTYGTRLAGIFLSGRLNLTGRQKAAFDAIPAAVLVSVIAPVALATGPAETVATVIAGISATRMPLLVTILVGVASVVLLRMAMP
ncbi:membrane protein [Labrys miyagiensis]